MLDGEHALSKVGQRLADRGMVALRQPGRTRASRHDERFGHLREALIAAPLHQVSSAVVLKALEGYTIPPPWGPQETTTRAFYGAAAAAPQPPGAPRPAYGQSTDGRDALKQGLRSLGVRGDGGIPLVSVHRGFARFE